MRELRTGLVGCGKVGHLHAAALQTLPESEFVAVCSRSKAKANDFAAQYGVAAYSDLMQMMDQEKLDVLCVCTPHPKHAVPAVMAAQLGVHVLVEKPLASTVEDCSAMLATADAAGIVLGTISQRRFYPPCQRIDRAIRDGKLGKPILGNAVILGWRDEAYYRSDPWRGTWRGEGGGVLVNQSPHQLDLLLWYMGEAEEVFGYWANLNHPTIEVDDTAVAVVRFKSGALGNILVSTSQNPAIHARVSVHGSNGVSVGVQTDGGAMFIAGSSEMIEPPFNDIWTIPGEESKLLSWKEEDALFFSAVNPMEHFHQIQIQDFLLAVIEGRSPQVTGNDGRRVTELIAAIYQSNQEGKPVRLVGGG